jgi:hypothetical protein
LILPRVAGEESAGAGHFEEGEGLNGAQRLNDWNV